MTRERFEQIFNTESYNKVKGDNAFKGLLIIAKYFNIEEDEIITGAEHDEFFSVDIDDILNAGITEEDAIALEKLNWMISSEADCLCVFV